MDGGYDRALIYDEPRRLDLKTDVAYYHNLDGATRGAEHRATSPRLLTAEAGLYFTNTRKSRGAVDDEKGVLGQRRAARQPRREPDDPAAARRAGLRRRAADRPFVAVAAQRRRRRARRASNPYANFFIGGFGNNYVDARVEKRYREYYAFPGFGLNEISGRSSRGTCWKRTCRRTCSSRRHGPLSISRGCGRRSLRARYGPIRRPGEPHALR